MWHHASPPRSPKGTQWLTTSSRPHLADRLEDARPGLAVERIRRDSIGAAYARERGRVLKRDGARVRVDFSASGGPRSTWVLAQELRTTSSPSSPPRDFAHPQLLPEPEPEPEPNAGAVLQLPPPASPPPTPTPRTRQRTLELLQTVNERMVHEHRALSRAVSNAEAAEQEAGALDAELVWVNDELVRLATPTPTSSRSPAGQRWRKAEHLVSTPIWLRSQVRDELKSNIGFTSKLGSKAHVSFFISKWSSSKHIHKQFPPQLHFQGQHI